jgi:hypothetical protein
MTRLQTGLKELKEKYGKGKVPVDIFKGFNFMTPECVMKGVVCSGVYVGVSKGNVEVSKGKGFTERGIIGVTFRGEDGERFKEDPSEMVYSYQEAADLISKVKEELCNE